jgi:clostripain
VLNEILYFEDLANSNPLRAHEWVEIYNPGPDLNLSGWFISNRTGRSGSGARAFPSIVMPQGTYLVVHFAAGTNDNNFTNGMRNYYTGDPAGINLFNDSSDEVALYSPAGIIDFLAWNTGATGYFPGAAHNDAVAAGQWTAGAFLNAAQIQRDPTDKPRTVEPGTSIGRNRNSLDTNSPPDFDAHGGGNAFDITPGAQNYQRLYVVDKEGEKTPTPKKKWTVMLYMVADDELDNEGQSLEFPIYKNVKDAETAGGSDNNVNVVVMLDGINMITQATLQGNNLEEVPNTRGRTWQFQLGSANGTACGTKRPDCITMLYSGQKPFIDEQNMGDPATLTGFVNWAKINYPAEKYALIISGHGSGWQGVGFDDTPGKDCIGRNCAADPLYMGELRTTFDGNSFELIGFDACLMAMIEVAYQVRPYANYMVASEEIIPGAGWPFEQWVGDLKRNAQQWTGADLGKAIVTRYQEFYKDDRTTAFYTLSAINEEKLPDLANAVSNFATVLKAANDDFKTHDTPADNVQNRILLAASKDLSNSNDKGVERYFSYYFMDLGNFVSRIESDSEIPDKYKQNNIDALLAALGKSVIANVNGNCRPQATGLSIFMPLTRTRFKDVRQVTDACENELDDRSYDYITARKDTGDSQGTVYAANQYKLPLQAKDPEATDQNNFQLTAPQQFPRLPAPDFLFATETQWPAFLQRLYRPVANNHIVEGKNPDGSMVVPISIPSGQDGILQDEITVSPGATVTFSGRGSSSADTEDRLPRHWMWDFDDKIKSCSPCIAPSDQRITKNQDAADAANDHMDADWTGTTDATDNQKDADSELVDHVFCQDQQPRDYIVTLNVWDDNHTFHKADPDGRYVHIQTAGHKSVVHCRAVTAASIAATGGTPQSANINTAFGAPLQATVTDAAGKPASGVQVMFSAPTSGPSGLFGGQSTTMVATDAQGHAAATITANSMAGSYEVVASAANVTGSAVFVLTNVLPGATQLVFAQQPTDTPAGQAITPPVKVQVRDSARNPDPVSGIPITLSLSSGTGALSGTVVQMTDSTGTATFSDLRINQPGTKRLRATSDQQTPADSNPFQITAGTAASITVFSGAPQSTKVSQPFPSPLQAILKDGGGNPVSGVSVTFAAPTSGPSGTFAGLATVTTDSNGIATAPDLTANSQAGTFTVIATATGAVVPAVFTLTNLPQQTSMISVNPNALTFASEINQPAPPTQTVQITATMSWTPSSSASWLTVSPASGSASGSITVSVNPAGLAVGVNTGSIGITGADSSVVPVLVTYTITAKTALVITPPVLVFRTPNNTTTPAAQTLTATSSSRTIAYRISAQVSTPGGGNWLQVSPAQGQTTGTVTVSANPAALASGVYDGSVLFTPTDTTLDPVTVPVTLIVDCGSGGCLQQPQILSVVNGASFQPGGAPRAIMTIFGTGMSDGLYQSSTNPLPVQLGPTTVTVNGLPAHLFYVSPTQINFQMSSGIEASQVQVVVSNQAVVSSRALRASPEHTATLTEVDPGLFVTTDRRASALNGDLSLHTAATPVPAGGYIILFTTGEGSVTPPVLDGVPAPSSPLSIIDAPVQVTIGGKPAVVNFQGLAPGFTSLGQLNVIVPAGLAPGDQPVFVTINGKPSNAGVITVN